jgi:hypothetical protein
MDDGGPAQWPGHVKNDDQFIFVALQTGQCKDADSYFSCRDNLLHFALKAHSLHLTQTDTCSNNHVYLSGLYPQTIRRQKCTSSMALVVSPVNTHSQRRDTDMFILISIQDVVEMCILCNICYIFPHHHHHRSSLPSIHS